MALNQAFKWALSFRGATALLLLLMASLSLLAFSNVRVITASGTISAITPQSLQGTKSMAWGREHAAWCKSQHIPMELEAAPLPWETDDPAMSIPDGTRLAVWSIGRGDYFQLAGVRA